MRARRLMELGLPEREVHEVNHAFRASQKAPRATATNANNFRTLSDTRSANICEILARAVIAHKAAYLLDLCVLTRFSRNLQHEPLRVRIPLGLPLYKSRETG
jgi:hypothetical protein